MISNISKIEVLEQIVDLQIKIWGFNDRECIPSHIMLICNTLGGAVLAKIDDGKVVGFCAAFPGVKVDKTPFCYLHALGVDPQVQSKNIGFDILNSLRERCLTQGIKSIEWTFDPLETRNANLYLNKINGKVEKYVPNYYGTSAGGSEIGVESDRFFITWNILDGDDGVSFTLSEIYRSYNVISVLNADNLVFEDSKKYAIEVPSDFDYIKQNNVRQANNIRLNSRTIFLEIFNHKKKIDKFVVSKENGQLRSFYLTD